MSDSLGLRKKEFHVEECLYVSGSQVCARKNVGKETFHPLYPYWANSASSFTCMDRSALGGY